MRPQSIFAASFLLASTSLSFAQDVTFESLLDEMVDRDELAKTPVHSFTLGQASSYDRDNGPNNIDQVDFNTNQDGSGFIRWEDVNGDGTQEKVLMDVSGPGAIVRFWTTYLTWQFTNGRLRFYFDGSTTPAIDDTFLNIMTGSALANPANATLTDGILSTRTGEFRQDEPVNSGIGYTLSGVNLYMPIPYSSSCIVTYEGAEDPFYFAINHRNYDPQTTTVETFTMSDITDHAAKIDAVEAELESNLEDVTAGTSQVSDANRVLASGTSHSYTINDVNDLSGEAIRQIRAKISASNYKQALRSTIIEIKFDGVSKVWAPLGDFFCTGYQIGSEFDSRYHKVTHDGFMLSRWIMPYQTSAEITIHNMGSQDVTIDSLELHHSDWTWDARSLYFHTGWHNETNIPTFPRRDTNYVTIEGSGKYVGDSLAIFNNYDANGTLASPWWGEGDEKIYVDGEAFPSHFGTGTEDYYGYSWVGCATFSQPFLAQPIADANRSQGLSVNNRWRSLDVIPFQSSLQLDMEIWHWSSTDLDYAPTTFWYGTAATREVVDLTANPVVGFPKDIAGAQNLVRFKDVHEGEALMVQDNPDVRSIPYTFESGFFWSNRTALLIEDLDSGEELSTSFFSDSARNGSLIISGTKTSGTTTVELELNGEVITSDFNESITIIDANLIQGSNSLIFRGVAASGDDAILEIDKIEISDSGAGVVIMGTNDNIDSSLGTPSSQYNAVERLNDGIFGVDGNDAFVNTTFGGDSTPPTYGYVGINHVDTTSKVVTGVTIQIACFSDGGWFGPNGVSPGAGNALADPTHLTIPTVQVTSNNGATWVNIASSANNYLSVMSGALIGGGGQANPRYYTVTFPLDTPQTDINGIRLIGPEGGSADAGFIGAAEFQIQTADVGSTVAIIGTNNAIDTTLGTPYSQQGATSISRLNDGTLGVDGDFSNVNTTWGGDSSAPANGYLGLVNIDSTLEVSGLSAQLGCFYDGGWFGPNNSDPGSGGTLNQTHLSEPTVQVTSDNGVSWSNVSTSANNYLSVMNGAQIGTLGSVNPRYHTVTFPLDTPLRGINGIRLVGSEGGGASDAGFVAAAELELQTLPNDYANWIDDYSVGGLTSFDDDSDEDGLGNGLENFFGTNPGFANSGITAFAVNGSSVNFTHPQSANQAEDITGIYEWSTNLTDWNTSGDTFNGTTVSIIAAVNNPTVGTTTVTANTSGTPTEILFFRVKVTQN